MTTEEEAMDQLAKWRARPDIFVREVLGATPDPWQDEVLRAFPTKQRIAMKACKGPGKSCVLAWLGWNFLLTRPNAKVTALSITGKNLADGLWTEMALWQKRSELLRTSFTWTKQRIEANGEAGNTWWMSARTWSKDADAQEQSDTLAGLHQDNILILIDESGGIPQSVEIAAEAILSTCHDGREGHIVQAGNPTDMNGMLYSSCVKKRHLWHVVEITSDPDDALRSPRVSKAWAQEMIDTYGRDSPYVMVNVLGKFPPAGFNTLIGREEVEASAKRAWREGDYKSHPKILSVDVARMGEDSSVVIARQGLQMFNPWQYRNIDGTEGANRIARKWEEWQADACFIDDTGGFGSSWIDNLVRLGYAPIGVHFNERPDNKRFYNKRSEMLFAFVDWIKRGGAIPDIPELKEALCEVTYTFKGDAVLIEPKELLKARLGYSPDHLDAAILSWAQPVTKAGHGYVGDGMGRHKSEYNPLGAAYVKSYLTGNR